MRRTFRDDEDFHGYIDYRYDHRAECDEPRRPVPPPFYPDSDEEHRSLDAYCGREEPDDPEADEALLTNCAPEGLARPFHLDPIV